MGEEILAAEAARNDYAIAWSARGNPAQLALLECPIFEVFFGGARGGGKTDGMLGEWVRHADLYGEHAIGLMLRRTRTAELTDPAWPRPDKCFPSALIPGPSGWSKRLGLATGGL